MSILHILIGKVSSTFSRYTLDIGGVQTFAHKGINVQTDICEGAC